ncbi:MAG TPA: Druantia anti-phage system protein DruA [Terriglobales bacterium]|nr:Druantia anti-phage system protein DruA [Terriglobales bacterium]
MAKDKGGRLTVATRDLRSRNDLPDATSLRRAIHRHLLDLGFSKNCDGYFVDAELTKQKIRDLHAAQRRQILERNRSFIADHGLGLASHFATGRQVDPASIDPELVEVAAESLESRLFRLACLLWSVPVSQGFGRRLRFLVRDRQNGCLIGLFALGDPVFNLSARDSWIGWSHEDRCERLVHVMDAYVVGAVPPYSQLIGGKLVAALTASSEVMKVYERKYIGREAVISKKKNRARLVLLTTTSALGRSSIYNRLAIPNGPRFLRIGTTKGFGHFHLSGAIFESLRDFLEATGHPYASGHRFGMGPNWRIRVARTALEKIGIEGNAILKHGVEREVYAIPLASNWQEILLGKHKNVRSCTLPASEIADFCVNRWIVPRAARDKRYKRFARRRIMDCLLNAGPGSTW